MRRMHDAIRGVDMKNKLMMVLLVLVLALMLTGCELTPRSKALIVVNDSGADITQIQIREFVQDARDFLVNALDDGEVIAPNARKTFYLAPYNSSVVMLEIEGTSAYFLFDYKVDGKNQPITAEYDGTTITLSGSNVSEPDA